MTCERLKEGVCLLAGFPAPQTMCAHCRADGTGLFRANLAAHTAKQELRRRTAKSRRPSPRPPEAGSPLPQGEGRGEGGGTWPCDRFGLEVDELFCAECKRNPALKQLLASARTQALKRSRPCIHRGERTGEREVKCCGGRTKSVHEYSCAKAAGKPVIDQECLRCGSYRPEAASRSLPASCASWESLWRAHAGKTILVLACGPSVLLPGEDPSRETVDPRGLVRKGDGKGDTPAGNIPFSVDPRGVQADVVISTNWAWKWYEEIIDYQVSYDPTPCLGWRPGHVKLLTPVRPKGTMAVLERAHVYCFFPACDYGEIAAGKPLPCSRNSGFAALAFAAYAGAATIKVLGMDFSAREELSSGAPDGRSREGPSCQAAKERRRMHFYHETDFDVNRRVKSFDRQKERVQGDLSKLLATVRAAGVTVENLSPGSGLEW